MGTPRCIRVVYSKAKSLCILKKKGHKRKTKSSWYAKLGSESVSMACVKESLEEPPIESPEEFEVDVKGKCVQTNIDHPGGFIKKVSADSLSQCMEICSENQDCELIVALPKSKLCILKNNDHQEATDSTWLAREGSISISMECRKNRKKNRKNVAKKENDKFAVDIKGMCLEDGVRYPGGIIKTIDAVSSLSECKELCSENQGCIRIVADPESGMCLLKDDTHGHKIDDKRMVSVSMECKRKKKDKQSERSDKATLKNFEIDLAGPCIESNVDYPQGFLSQFDDVESLSECKKLCKKEEGCVRFIALASSNRCILKNSEHEDRTTEGWITKQKSYSASMECLKEAKKDKKDKDRKKGSDDNDNAAAFEADIEGPCIETNVDYPQGFIAQFDGVESLSECKKLCKKQKECVRFIALATTNRCILKNNEHEERTTEGWVTKQNSYSASMECLKEVKKDKKDDKKESSPPETEDSGAAFAVDIESTCIESSVDYPQGFISQLDEVESLSECKKLCKKQKECVRFIALASVNRCILKNDQHKERTTEGWITSQNSYSASMECLKEAKKEKKDKDGRKDYDDNESAAAFEADIEGACIETNVDYPQGFIAQFDEVDTLSECKKLCKKQKECVRFIALATMNRCILKNNEHEDRTTEGWVTSQNSYSASMDCLKEAKKDRNDEKKENNSSEKKDRLGAAFAVDIEGACIETNVDYPQGFISQLDEVESLSECQKLCKKQKECVRFIALASLNRCILKNDQHKERTSEGWITSQNSYSASMECLKEAKKDRKDDKKKKNSSEKEDSSAAFAVDIEGACIETNVDYPQGFISQLDEVESLSECKRLCKKQKECVRFIALASLNRCILKNNQHGESTTEGWITKQHSYSASMECLKEAKKDRKDDKKENNSSEKEDSSAAFAVDIEGACIESNVDYPQGFIAQFDEVESLSECKKLCKKQKECVRFIALASLKRCILKNDQHEERTTEGWVVKQNSYSASMECLKEAKKDRKDDKKENNSPEKEDSSAAFAVDIESACIESDVDYPQGFISQLDEVESLSECKKLCKKQKECVRFIALASLNRCILKNSQHEERTTEGWITKQNSYSASMECLKEAKKDMMNEKKENKSNRERDSSKNESGTKKFVVDKDNSCIETKVDYPQGFISQFDEINSISECYKLCKKQKGCVRFVILTSINRCILKNNEHKERTTEGWITTQSPYTASMDCLKALRDKEKDKTADFDNDLDNG